jgi:hypothetical protein
MRAYTYIKTKVSSRGAGGAGTPTKNAEAGAVERVHVRLFDRHAEDVTAERGEVIQKLCVAYRTPNGVGVR